MVSKHGSSYLLTAGQRNGEANTGPAGSAAPDCPVWTPRFGGFMGATLRGNATAGWIHHARPGRWPSVFFHPELKLLLVVCRKSPQLLCKYSTSTNQLYIPDMENQVWVNTYPALPPWRRDDLWRRLRCCGFTWASFGRWLFLPPALWQQWVLYLGPSEIRGLPSGYD